MRNKLQFAVALTNLFSSRNINKINSTSKKNNFQNRNLFFVFTLGLLLQFQNHGFAQISESFDSGIPGTWTIFNNGVGASDWASTTDGYLTTNGVSVNPSADNIGDQNTAQYFLVTPQFAVPENGEIQFFTKQSSNVDNGAQYQIRLSTAAQPDINGFNVVIQSYTEADLNVNSQTEYEKKVVEIPTSIPVGLNIYIAFVTVNTQIGTTPTGDEWFVDEVAVLEGCIEVDEFDVLLNNISVNGADLSWSHPEASNFEIQVLPTGGIPADSGIPVSGTSYILNNLDEDTEFDIYIRANCDNNSSSDWTGPITFETLRFGLTCEDPIIVPDISTTPYVLIENLQNFENPPEVVYTSQGTNCGVPGGSTNNYLNGDKIFLTYTPAIDGLLTLSQTTAVVSGGGDNNCWNDSSSLFVYESCADVGINCLAGTTTSDPFEPSTISNFLVQAGQTYVIVVSSQLSSGAGICFELEISNLVCAPSGDISYNSLTENSINFSWDNVGNFADSWEYAIVPVGSGEPSSNGIATATNIDVLINSGLVPNTTYDFYVRSVCGGTPGAWSNPKTFTTQCTVFSVPYSTDFSTATNENPEPCWTTIDANNDGTQWAFIGGYATVATTTNEGNNHDLYVSPQINFDATPKRVRYKHRATNGVSSYSVRLSTTGAGVDDFTTVLLPETQINNTTFQEIIVDIPIGITGNVNIAWIVEPNTFENATRISIDDVFIEDKPTCPDPTNPFTLNITTNSAWFAWTAGDIETQWQVAIQDEGSGIPTGEGVIANSNFPYVANGLQSGHRYEYYVRAYCDVDDQSNWVGPVDFITLCESYDTPFFESFDDEDPDTQKFCWEIVNQNADASLWIMNENEPSLQNGGGPFNPTTDFDDYLISPQINIDGVKVLKFKYRAQFSFMTGAPRFGLEVLMSTTNTNPFSFSVISDLEIFTNSEYIEKSIIIEGNGPVYIAFRVPPEFTGSYSILNIDDVSITDAPGCPNPSDLIVDTSLTDGADLSWTAGYLEDSWNVVVQPVGTGMPTTAGEFVTSPSFSATGLLPDSEYEFYVNADCDVDGLSEWVGPVAFRTLCTAFTTPFTETFNSDSDSESCWRVINDNDDLETWELDSAVFVYEGDQAAAMFTGQNGQNEDWLISPTITIPANQRLRYYYRVNDSFFTEDLEVLLSTNGTGLDQFTTVLYDSDDDPVLINNEEFKVKIINLPAGITGDINIAFHIPYFESTGAYRGQTLVIDNVNIEDIPDCPEPTNIVLNNITDTSVQVAWDANGPETAWEISVQPAGTLAPVGDTDPNYLYNATTNPFTVTGLVASTMYDIYVRAVCDGNTEGAWTGPKVVITKCSFDNLCEYTFVLYSDSSISADLDITQNNQITQSLPFNGIEAGEEFTLFLCSGVEFSVDFDSIGWNSTQYSDYYFEIIDDLGTIVYTSPTSMQVNTTIYSGTAVCGSISCPQPTDLAVDEFSVLSWTAGGSETQWEVAIQSVENATIPQSGTIVSTNSYLPTDADFNDLNAATYEYFVRAVCANDDESYWSGPFEFVRNDDISNALSVPINMSETCTQSAIDVSFTNSTASAEAMSCDNTGHGDVWFEFTAASTSHVIEINSFIGTSINGGFYPNAIAVPYPLIVMTLYKDNGSGNLEEITCSYDNILLAMYAAELEVGDNYKIRLTLNSPNTSDHKFKLCIKTPEDPCSFNLAVNGGFEEPVLNSLSGIYTITTLDVVPGWRQNLDSNNAVFIWEALNAPGFEPYEGGQCIQMLSDQDVSIDPNDPDVKGLYRDFESSEITMFDYSFAHFARFDGNTVQLLAGPPGGPYTEVVLHPGVTFSWEIVSGQYVVPNGQDITRFVFRAIGDNNVGNNLDAISFMANNQIVTQDHEVDCNISTTTVQAEGVGTWSASDTNPSPVTFADANSGSTSISGFAQPGTYTMTWSTSHCEYDIELAYNGIGDIPAVDTPIEYCLNTTAQPLSATASGSYSLLWYTQAVGGTGSATAPTPDTSILGISSYYVAHSDGGTCEGPRAEIIVTVSDAITPELTFSYATTCEIFTDNPLPSLNVGFDAGGVFSSTTLTVDPSTGEIDMASATAGQHDVVYTFSGDPSTCALGGTYTATIDFTMATVPETTFDYGNSPFCLLADSFVLPNLATNFTQGGLFSSATLNLDAVTGDIDLTSAAPGNHDITYTIDADPINCIQSGTTTTSIEVIATITPETAFTYNSDTFCSDNANEIPNLGTDFTIGGVFSAEIGLAIDPVTGEINIASSTTGNYTISYVYAEDLSTCIEASSSSFMLTIMETISPELTFDYGNSPFCLLAGDSVLPNLGTGFSTGGTFSSSTLTVNASTGEIELTSAATGMHDVLYTFDADIVNCIQAGTFTASIEIVSVITSITGFVYSETVLCSDSNNISPELDAGFTTGGVFSSQSGLSINTSTGEINVSGSGLGNYTVSYEITEDQVNCIEGSVSTYDVTILDSIDVSISGACNDSVYWLTASPVNDSYNPNDVTYTWMDSNGNIVGQDSDVLNVTEYADQNPNAQAPLQFLVTIDFGGCSITATHTSERSACREIPRGISPDGNGKNDTFDLSGFGVTDILIFNRNGIEVYRFNGTYTNQWYGQSNKGNDLPDGTYFYNIMKVDGSTETGWVYINRAH